MLDISFLCRNDFEELKRKVGFSEEEAKILNELYSGTHDDTGIMAALNISSRNKFYNIKKSMLRKIIVTAVRSKE